MKIKSLRAPAFKGCDIDQNFKSFNLIVGRNFEGKSAISQAIQVALFGCLPSLGETNAITMQLSSNDREMFVRATFDDDSTNTLALTCSDSGIKRSFEAAHIIPRVLIDAQEYFDLSTQDRLDYVLKRVNVKKCGYDENAFRELLFTATLPIAEKVQSRTFATWEENFKASVRQRENTNSSVMDWMESLLSRLKSAKKTSDDKIKAIKPQISTLQKTVENVPDDVTKKREVALQKLSEAKAKLIVADSEKLDNLCEELNAAADRVSSIKSEISNCEANESKMRRHKSCPTCKAKGVDWLKSWLEDNEAIKKPLELGLKSAQEEVRELKKKVDAERDKISKPDKKLQKAVDDAQFDYDEQDELYDRRSYWEKDRDRLRTLEKEMAELLIESQTLKGMVEHLVEYQKGIVVKAFAMLLKTARRFTDGILRGNLEYHDGDLGYWRDKTFVRHRTFSGTEQLLAYSGLQIALAQESPIRLAIFDEMGRIRDDLCSGISKRIYELIEDGTIDQAILIDTTDRRYALQTHKIHLIELK